MCSMVKIKKKREQSGSFHVYFRGNHRFNVFSNDTERLVFLKLCNKYSQSYMTVIQEFVLMDNHVHLQVFTHQLTKFMRILLHSFSIWYNKEKGVNGTIFESPFNSSIKRTREWMIDSMLYILQNPIKAGICKHPKDYKWSSYHFHFQQYDKTSNPLNSVIDINTSFIDQEFTTKSNLAKAVISKNLSISGLKENADYKWKRINDVDFWKFVNTKIERGKSIYYLTENELASLVLQIRNETGASYRQIAVNLHIPELYVRKICSVER